MKVFNLFMDPFKEEAWLNQMGREHWRLVNVWCGVYYQFEKSDKEFEYECAYVRRKKDVREILKNTPDSAITHVTTSNSFAYFMKERDQKLIQLFPSWEAKQGNLERIARKFEITSIIILSLACFNAGIAICFDISLIIGSFLWSIFGFYSAWVYKILTRRFR